MTATDFWMGVFFVSGAVFWSVAVWAVVRGGKDVLDIISSEHGKK